MRKFMFECEGHYIFDIHEGETPSSCEHLPFYKEYGAKKYCVLHFPGQEKFEHFEKALEEKLIRRDYNFRNIWFPDGVYFGCHRFKSEVDFSYAVFNGEANFEKSTFQQEAIFDSAKFKSKAIFIAVTFGTHTSFFNSTFEKSATFHGSDFGNSMLKSDVNFFQANFVKKVDFSNVRFNCSVDFNSAKFNKSVSFERSYFTSKAEFKNAVFKDYVRFFGEYTVLPANNVKKEFNKIFGEESSLNLQFTIFEKPERVLFHTTLLKPHWFVNVDSRKFEFTNIEWKNLENSTLSVKFEIEDLYFRLYENIISPYTLFAIACRRLAINAEENNRLKEASNFRQMAFETEWLEKKERFRSWINNLPNESDKLKRRFGGSESKEDKAIPPTNSFAIAQNFDFVHFLYRFTSYYGESWRWALGVLFGIWLTFSVIYTQVGFSVCPQNKTTNAEVASANCERGLYISEAMKQSFGTMFLQKSENRNPLETAETFILIETVLAPLQIALLALAIRRKFMR